MESNQLILPNSLLATIGTSFQVGALRAFRGPAHVARTSTPRIDFSPHDIAVSSFSYTIMYIQYFYISP
jgi:hypothetical protein